MDFSSTENTAQEETREAIVSLDKSFIYQGDSLILSDVNFKLHKGEFRYIIGKTGSGKSSFLKTLYADIPLIKGEGEVAEFKLHKLKNKQVPFLRRKIGIVFQDFQLLTDRSVNDNLSFVLKATGWKNKSDIKMQIDEVLSKVGLKTKGFKMPHELSGGEQQRVVIARALLNNPKLIIADEPTGNLDPETSDDIMNLIFDLHKNLETAVIMATHNYSIIEKYPAKIIKCVNGKVVTEQGIEF